jgi:light-regulated signal transduction histidine kinase (bacteriophytochrome)
MATKLADNLAEIRLSQDQIETLNKDLENKIAKRTAQLEALLKEHEAFNYTVSHDLRAPLRHIDSFSAILTEELGSDVSPECLGYLQRIRNATSKMGVLIDDLLELSRLSREEMKMERVDLSRIGSEVVTCSRRPSRAGSSRSIASDLSPKVTRGCCGLFFKIYSAMPGNIQAKKLPLELSLVNAP